ncbi:unnamed protein product [Soboliphyme baturini]|uniref:Uncharacterized protein n=1 Tax=Soboliphyme baturini TaxID=241478 RepID=A0A183IYV5_9BILA|nr:unnamed protein product [Soboliphyme baturini]
MIAECRVGVKWPSPDIQDFSAELFCRVTVGQKAKDQKKRPRATFLVPDSRRWWVGRLLTTQANVRCIGPAGSNARSPLVRVAVGSETRVKGGGCDDEGCGPVDQSVLIGARGEARRGKARHSHNGRNARSPSDGAYVPWLTCGLVQ